MNKHIVKQTYRETYLLGVYRETYRVPLLPVTENLMRSMSRIFATSMTASVLQGRGFPSQI